MANYTQPFSGMTNRNFTYTKENPYDPNNNYGQSQVNPNTPPVNPLQDFDSANFNVADPQQVRELQSKMGVTVDGMFGPETEKAYRGFINQKRESEGKEAYTYDSPQKDGFGFGEMINPFSKMQRNREQGLGMFGKPSGFASGQGILANWKPRQNIQEGRGVFGKQDGFGSGKGWMSRIGQGGEGFMGKFGTGEGTLAQLGRNLGNFINRNQSEDNLNNKINNILQGGPSKVGVGGRYDLSQADTLNVWNNQSNPQFNQFDNPYLTTELREDLGINPNPNSNPMTEVYEEEPIPNWLDEQQKKKSNLMFGGY